MISPSSATRIRSFTSTVSAAGGRPVSARSAATRAVKRGRGDLPGGQVHRDPDVPADDSRQAAPCAHASRSTHSPERDDEAGFLGGAEELPRRATTSSPRHQRTSASAPVTREVARSTIGW